VTAWQPLDCHAHSTWSDGALEPEAVLATVRARGVRPSITDHVSREVARAVHTPARAAAYAEALAPLTHRGAEFCSHDTLWRELPSEIHASFTHRIGSLHAVTLPDGSLLRMAAHTPLPAGLSRAAYMEVHVAAVEALLPVMPIEIFAHPTMMPRELRAVPGEELWTEAQEQRVVDALRRHGIVFEVSNRYRPHERFVARALAAGVRLSLGSDGHTAVQIGDIAWPLALVTRLGVPSHALYDPLVHGTRHA
jgi:histidinol phosphatase-like PHP family hydrolase